MYDISHTKKYRLTPIKTDNENYFYGLFFKKHLLDFNKDKLYFTVFFNDVIKYNKVLEFTYANIYESAGLRFDYLFNNIANYLKNHVHGDDIIITLGAGTITNLSKYLL